MPSRAFRVFLVPPMGEEVSSPTVLRFDDAEPKAEWGFAHAQLCELMTPYETWFGEKHACWVSTALPRIPLAARSGAEPILVCLIAGLYGVTSDLLALLLRTLAHDESTTTAERLGWKTKSCTPHPKWGRMCRSPGAVLRMIQMLCRIFSSAPTRGRRPSARGLMGKGHPCPIKS